MVPPDSLGKTETSSDGKYVLRDSRMFLMHGERFDTPSPRRFQACRGNGRLHHVCCDALTQSQRDHKRTSSSPRGA
ncbi:hypothetical protein ACRRTK_000551 [Alexandromys fortis]